MQDEELEMLKQHEETKEYKGYDTEIAPFGHKLNVIGYDSEYECHYCTVVGTPQHVSVDLLVSGCFDSETDPYSLIGKTVSVDYTHGFLFLAEGVKVLD